LLLTKRPENIEIYLPNDINLWNSVWLGVTVEDQDHGVPRIDTLRSMRDYPYPRFLSVEPLLEGLGELDLHEIDWVIVGGESGPRARPMEPQWVYDIQDQCADQNVPFFFKQWGGRLKGQRGCLLEGHEVKEWPELLQPTVGQ
jgi:protein gp37